MRERHKWEPVDGHFGMRKCIRCKTVLEIINSKDGGQPVRNYYIDGIKYTYYVFCGEIPEELNVLDNR